MNVVVDLMPQVVEGMEVGFVQHYISDLDILSHQ